MFLELRYRIVFCMNNFTETIEVDAFFIHESQSSLECQLDLLFYQQTLIF